MSYYDDDDYRNDFQDPGGRSALRRASKNNKRNLPCPTCERPNMLTPKDRQLGYQCNICADRDEGYGYQLRFSMTKNPELIKLEEEIDALKNEN